MIVQKKKNRGLFTRVAAELTINFLLKCMDTVENNP